MNYRDYPRLWRTAYYLIHDQGAPALPIGEPLVVTQRRGDRTMLDWAVDLRALVPEHLRKAVDDHYLQPSNEYRRIPRALRPTLRYLWLKAEKRGLFNQGLRVVEILHG